MSLHVAQYLQRRTVVTVEAEQVEAEQVEADCASTAVRLRQGVMGEYDDSTRI
jgi:phosphoribosylaminoimidazole carboxylase (NCAIR synthetase)